MTTLPDEPEISITRRLRLELTDSQIHEIVKQWAKTRGFTHRCEVELVHDGSRLYGAIVEHRPI